MNVRNYHYKSSFGALLFAFHFYARVIMGKSMPSLKLKLTEAKVFHYFSFFIKKKEKNFKKENVIVCLLFFRFPPPHTYKMRLYCRNRFVLVQKKVKGEWKSLSLSLSLRVCHNVYVC